MDSPVQQSPPAICIVGMHRSGTSMVARLLHRCGVHLGDDDDLAAPAPDNPQGFSENRHFVEINERLLSRFDGGWDAPPRFPADWPHQPELSDLRARAGAQIARMAERGVWGWKDPRSTLTLPFWQSLLPDLRVVACVRHPLDVARSLRQRNYTSVAYGQRLWHAYYQALDAAVSPAHRLVTHYDRYFGAATEELRRLLDGLGLPYDDATLDAAVKDVDPHIRHHHAAAEAAAAALPEDLLALYLSLCAEAERSRQAAGGPSASDTSSATRAVRPAAPRSPSGEEISKREAREHAARVEKSAAEVAARDATIGDLQAALDGQTRWARESAALVADLRRQIDELVMLSRRSPVQRLRDTVRSSMRRGPRIRILHPAWTAAGERFNTQQDGQAHLAVEGSGFGSRAVLVVAGRALDTYHASDRLLSAGMPDEFLRRPRVFPVWVDNRAGGRLSAIRCFRVLSERMAAAYRPALGRWRHARNVLGRLLRLAAAVSWRIRLPLLYARRGWEARWRELLSGRRRQRRVALPPGVAAHIKPTSIPRKPDVICFPIIDWDFRYQRPQQILSRLAHAGHRVFYLSERFLGPADETFRLRPLAPGVTEVRLVSPSRLNIYQDAIQGQVEETLYGALLDFKAAVGLGETICFVHLPFWTPLALRLKADLGYRVVFDCLDDFSAFRNIGNRMLELERALAARADQITASSLILAQKHAAGKPLLVPNAADYAHFSAAMGPTVRPDGTGPVLGYYGAISHWFDGDLIAGAAAARPDWRFVLIGRADPGMRATLDGLPNVRLLGELPYGELPAHLAAFDACLIPFVVDDLTRATSPVKFFEYLAAGKPVVASRMPELLSFSGACFLYEGLPEFLGQVDRALAEKDDPARVEARRAIARANTWEARVAVLRRSFQHLYPRASVIVVTYNNLEMTRACVESMFEKTAYADWELIVVDNDSSDGTPDFLRSLSERRPSVRIVLNGTNRGFAAASNQGVRIATGQFVVFLNNDTVVTQGWLGRLLRHLGDPGVGMVGPVTNNIGNEAKIEAAYADMSDMEPFADTYTRQHTGRVFDIAVLALFCAAIGRALLDEVGMLDERYEIGMFEDDDLSRSVRARGYRVICAEDVFVHHVGRAAFRQLDAEVYQGIFDSNRKRYEEKWGEPWAPHRYRRSDGARTPLALTAGPDVGAGAPGP